MNFRLPVGTPLGKPLNLARDPRDRKKVGKLEITVGNELKETLQVRLNLNGKKFYKISGKVNSVTEETDVAWREYSSDKEMVDYVSHVARKKYQSWIGRIVNQPPVEVEYLTHRELLDRDVRRMEERKQTVQYNI